MPTVHVIEGINVPLLDLYSMIVVKGRFSTLRIVSLEVRQTLSAHDRTIASRTGHALDLFLRLGTRVVSVPQRYDVLVLPHANRAPADFGELPVGVCVRLRPGRFPRVYHAVELVPNHGEDEVFPEAVRDAFAETDDPFAAREVQRVLPDRPANA